MKMHQVLIDQLVATWHQTIPLSQFMQVNVVSFVTTNDAYINASSTYSDALCTPDQLITTAPLAPNINLHNTMFAGSIYTLMTLTGWGMVWLQQKLAAVEGDIVLADAQIKYHAPVRTQPTAKVVWPDVALMPLTQGRRVKSALTVELWCDELLCASFKGLYVSLPVQIK